MHSHLPGQICSCEITENSLEVPVVRERAHITQVSVTESRLRDDWLKAPVPLSSILYSSDTFSCLKHKFI